MKYDVFISYSRKDTAIADKVCAAFDRVGISYFIDRQGIGGGFEFPRVLAENIIGSQLFLLLASENAYASKFTTNEIIFAFNKKPKQSILPYIIDGSSLPLELEFTFAGINWRNIADHPIDSVLVTDILGLLGRPAKTTQSAPAPAKPQPKVEVKPQPEPVAKTYKVGDYYDDGTKRGVVFYVSGDGCHGKIVGLDQERLAWCIDRSRFGKKLFRFGKSTEVVGVADSESDGKANTNQMMTWSDEDLPAFVWSRFNGNEWYLPAINELRTLLCDDSVLDAVNGTIAQKGGVKLFTKGDDVYYWSSTEYLNAKDCVWSIHMYTGYSRIINKFEELYVRAVAEF